MENNVSQDLSTDKLPIKKALLWILLSVLFISGSAIFVFGYFKIVSKAHMQGSTYEIVAIVQTSPETQGLRTGYLAELFNLSIDNPTNLYAFNSQEAKDKLLSVAAIKDATVRKIRPGTIHVDYQLRKPLAYIGDYSNTAIDEKGVLFPFNPFFTPKNLPEIYLGLEYDLSDASILQLPIVWGKQVVSPRLDLAYYMLSLVQKNCCDENSMLIRMDLSKAYAASFGERQIILEFEDRTQSVSNGSLVVDLQNTILRLATHNYEQQLANYLVLRNHLRQNKKLSLESQTAPSTINKALKITVIDLRLSELAFISQSL